MPLFYEENHFTKFLLSDLSTILLKLPNIRRDKTAGHWEGESESESVSHNLFSFMSSHSDSCIYPWTFFSYITLLEELYNFFPFIDVNQANYDEFLT